MPDVNVGGTGVGTYFPQFTTVSGAEVSIDGGASWGQSVAFADGTQLTAVWDAVVDNVKITASVADALIYEFNVRTTDDVEVGPAYLTSVRGFGDSIVAPDATLEVFHMDTGGDSGARLSVEQVVPVGDAGAVVAVVKADTVGRPEAAEFVWRETVYSFPGVLTTDSAYPPTAVVQIDADGDITAVSWAQMGESVTAATRPGASAHVTVTVAGDGLVYANIYSTDTDGRPLVLYDADGTTHSPTRVVGDEASGAWAKLDAAGVWQWVSRWTIYRGDEGVWHMPSHIRVVASQLIATVPAAGGDGSATMTIDGLVSERSSMAGVAVYLDTADGTPQWAHYRSGSYGNSVITIENIFSDASIWAHGSYYGGTLYRVNAAGTVTNLGTIGSYDAFRLSSSGALGSIVDYLSVDGLPYSASSDLPGRSMRVGVTSAGTDAYGVDVPATVRYTQVAASVAISSRTADWWCYVTNNATYASHSPYARLDADGSGLVVFRIIPADGEPVEAYDHTGTMFWTHADLPADAPPRGRLLVGMNSYGVDWWAYVTGAGATTYAGATTPSHGLPAGVGIGVSFDAGQLNGIRFIDHGGTDVVGFAPGVDDAAAAIALLSAEGRWGKLNGPSVPDPTPSDDPDNPAVPYLSGNDWPGIYDPDGPEIVGVAEEGDRQSGKTFVFVDPQGDADATSQVELWDPHNRVWFTTPVVGLQTQQHRFDGIGWWTVRQHTPDEPAEVEDPNSGNQVANPDYIPPHTAVVDFEPDENWYGLLLSAVRLVLERADGTVQESAATWLKLDYEDLYTRITDPDGQMPDTVEGGTSVGTYTVDDPDALDGVTDKTVAWQLSPAADDTDPNHNPATSISVYGPDPDDPNVVEVVGSAYVSGSGLSAQVAFDGQPYGYGTATFYVRASDGGDGQVDGDPGNTSWVAVTVDVAEVVDPPGSPQVVLPDIYENDQDGSTGVATWTDVDSDGGSLEVSRTGGTSGWEWSSDAATLMSGVVELGDSNDSVYDNDGVNRQVRVRFRPQSNFSGPVSFFLRVRDPELQETGDGQLTAVYSDTVEVTLTVNADPSAPSAPTPATMPTVERGEQAVGRFTVTPHPSAQLFRWEVSEAGGLTLDTVGQLTIEDDDPATPETRVRFTPDGDFTGRYRYDLRAVDITDPAAELASQATTVVGYVEPSGVEGRPGRRNPTTGQIDPLPPLQLADLEVIRALDTGAPGGLRATVDASQLVGRAGQVGGDPMALLEPYRTELAVTYDGIAVFAGPIVDTAYQAGTAKIRIECEGLAGLFHGVRQENPDGQTFTGVEQTAIAWQMIAAAQQQPDGQLGLADGTATTSQARDHTWQFGQTLADSLSRMFDTPNGAELWVTPERVVRAEAVRGADKTDRIALMPSAGDIVATITSDDVYTVVTAQGGDPGSGPLTAVKINTDAAAEYGRRGWHIDAPGVMLQTTLDDIAQDVLDRVSSIYRELTVTVRTDAGSPWSVWDLESGDRVKVRFWSDELARQVVEVVRVVGATIRQVDGDGRAFEADVDVEVLPGGVVRPRRAPDAPEFYRQLSDLYGRV